MTNPSALSPDTPAQAQAPAQVQEEEQDPYPSREPVTAREPDPQEPAPTRTENELRRRLGLDPLEWALPRAVRIRGWVATGVVGLIAALTRLIGLNHPSTLMFDEIYYVKDAYALWTVGYEAQWAEGSDALFAAGDFSGMSAEPSYVVHPQFGKWLIGLGMQVLGADSPWGWRIVPAIAGIATVVLLARLTMRLTRSPLLAGLAGLLLAIDGVGITESRIGLLDVLIGGQARPRPEWHRRQPPGPRRASAPLAVGHRRQPGPDLLDQMVGPLSSGGGGHPGGGVGYDGAAPGPRQGVAAGGGRLARLRRFHPPGAHGPGGLRGPVVVLVRARQGL